MPSVRAYVLLLFISLFFTSNTYAERPNSNRSSLVFRAEFDQLLAKKVLVELSASYFGSYVASLFINTNDGFYYAVLRSESSYILIRKIEGKSKAVLLNSNFVKRAEDLARAETTSIETSTALNMANIKILEKEVMLNKLNTELAMQTEIFETVKENIESQNINNKSIEKTLGEKIGRFRDLDRSISELSKEIDRLNGK